jgi:hypothetical protein
MCGAGDAWKPWLKFSNQLLDVLVYKLARWFAKQTASVMNGVIVLELFWQALFSIKRKTKHFSQFFTLLFEKVLDSKHFAFG